MWTCDWCGRHMFDGDERWSLFGYGKYCSQRCAQSAGEQEKKQFQSSPHEVECQWCGKKFVPAGMEVFCSYACHEAYNKNEAAKAPRQPNIRVSFGYNFINWNEVQINYFNFINQGNGASGPLRIAVYRTPDENGYKSCTLLGYNEMGSALEPNYRFNDGTVKISITNPPIAGEYFMITVDSFENGKWFTETAAVAARFTEAMLEELRQRGTPPVKSPAAGTPTSYIEMQDQGLNSEFIDYNTVDVSFGRIVNSGAVASGPIRLAMYSTPSSDDWRGPKTLLGFYEFGSGLNVNEQFNAGTVRLSISQPGIANEYGMYAIEKFEQGQWLICAYRHGGLLNKSLFDSLYNDRNWGKTVFNIEPGRFDIHGNIFEFSCNRILNKSDWKSGPIRWALYCSKTSSIAESIKIGRTFLGASESFDCLNAGQSYGSANFQVEVTGFVPDDNKVLIVLEEASCVGKWFYRSGWDSGFSGPYQF